MGYLLSFDYYSRKKVVLQAKPDYALTFLSCTHKVGVI